jgi:hypothetical protein
MFRTLAVYIDTIVYDIAMDTFICLIAILYFSANGREREGERLRKREGYLILFYLSLSLLDMMLKLMTKGWYRYVRSNRNSLDGISTVIIFALCLSLLAKHHGSVTNIQTDDSTGGADREGESVGIATLMLFRTLLYPRNLIVTPLFKRIRHRNRLAFNYAFRSSKHFLFLSLLLLAWLYAFAALGLQLFGGTIVKTGERGERIKEHSLYGEGGYWPLNFNDMLSALVTMFVLLHVNNTHVTTSGFVSGTDSQWAELFFALW